MGVIKTFILLAIVSSTYATIISQQCWYDVYVLNQAEAVPKLGASCLCPPLHGYEVSQAIKKADSDLERVVVFYYRDKTNNDIYMFTPSKDKQFSIPELPFGKDDDLYKINSDFSLRPFESSTITILVDTQNENPSTHHYPHQKMTNAQEQLLKVDHSSNIWYDQNNGPHIVTVDYPHLYDQKIEQLFEIVNNSHNPWHGHKQGQNVVTIDYPNYYDQKIEQNMEVTGNSNNALHEHKKEQIVEATDVWYDHKDGPHIVSVDYPHLNDLKIDQLIETVDNSQNAWHNHKQGQNVVSIDYPNLYDQTIEHLVELVDNSHNAWHDQKQGPNVVTIDYPNLYDHKQEKNVPFIDYPQLNDPKIEQLVDYKKEENVGVTKLWNDMKNGPHIVSVDSPYLNEKIEKLVGILGNTHNAWHDHKKGQNVVTIDYPNLYDHKQEKIVQLIDYPHLYEQKMAQNFKVAGKSRDAWHDYPNLYDEKIENTAETTVNTANVENVVTTDITNLNDNKNEQVIETNVLLDSSVPENSERDGKLEVVLHTYETYDEWPKQVSSSKPTDFKTWYSHQTTHLPELNSRDSQHISIDELQSHLVNLLKRYGYCVTNNQVLNVNREPVDLSHYRLIRVIIRAPDDEQHLTSNVIGVMLVNMSPLTILGVVPLRNTFDETNIQGWDDKENVLGKYKFISHNVTVRNNLLSNENMTLENEAGGNEKYMNNLFTKLGNVLGHIVPSSKTLEPTRRDSGEDVLPGFRIIGGNPATGSGTPITSKGRSAAP